MGAEKYQANQDELLAFLLILNFFLFKMIVGRINKYPVRLKNGKMRKLKCTVCVTFATEQSGNWMGQNGIIEL